MFSELSNLLLSDFTNKLFWELKESYGYFVFSEIPDNSTVKVDGMAVTYKNPVQVAPGEHVVSIENDNFQPWNVKRQVNKGEHSEVIFQNESLSGFLQASARDEDGNSVIADIYIDNKDSGEKTPISGMKVPAGKHEISIQKGSLEARKVIVIKLNKITEFNAVIRDFKKELEDNVDKCLNPPTPGVFSVHYDYESDPGYLHEKYHENWRLCVAAAKEYYQNEKYSKSLELLYEAKRYSDVGPMNSREKAGLEILLNIKKIIYVLVKENSKRDIVKILESNEYGFIYSVSGSAGIENKDAIEMLEQIKKCDEESIEIKDCMRP